MAKKSEREAKMRNYEVAAGLMAFGFAIYIWASDKLNMPIELWQLQVFYMLGVFMVLLGGILFLIDIIRVILKR